MTGDTVCISETIRMHHFVIVIIELHKSVAILLTTAI